MEISLFAYLNRRTDMCRFQMKTNQLKKANRKKEETRK